MCEAYVEGKIDVQNDKLVKAIEKQNVLLTHQNTILSKLVDEIILIRMREIE